MNTHLPNGDPYYTFADPLQEGKDLSPQRCRGRREKQQRLCVLRVSAVSFWLRLCRTVSIRVHP